MDWPGLSTRTNIKKPLDTAYWFYQDTEGLQVYAEQSYDFMQKVCQLESGTILYIGNVINYHF